MDETKHLKPTAESIFLEYESGVHFKNQINLFDTVETNENFFIGKQWEGVESNGLPTPVFNFLKRVVLFQVASILSDNIKMQAAPLALAPDQRLVEQVAEVVSNEFDALFEHNKIGFLLREFMRNAAVDGDGCTFTYWDADIETGQAVKGAIVTEVLENTRVFFGNPNERRVQKQPYILVEHREMRRDVRRRAKANGVAEADCDAIQADSAPRGNTAVSDDRVTVLLRLWRDDDSGEIWACEAARGVMLRRPWNLGIRLYPLTWLNWDYVQNCCHGQAMITGLIPNQIFVNKTFAMQQLSMMQTAFPKVVYDKTRISKWTNQAGVAIGVNGGNMNDIARIIEPAHTDSAVPLFIDKTIDYTQTFLGATAAALGNARPDNTSAIIALQRASSIPSEITRQNLYQSIEDLGGIYLEFMSTYYGTRTVKAPAPDLTGLPVPPGKSAETIDFDFSTLRQLPMTLKLDVGASSYWSEIASMQTLDNLLVQGRIELDDYLERVPEGYISRKQALIEKLRHAQTPVSGASGLPGLPGGGVPNLQSALGAPMLTQGLPAL